MTESPKNNLADNTPQEDQKAPELFGNVGVNSNMSSHLSFETFQKPEDTLPIPPIKENSLSGKNATESTPQPSNEKTNEPVLTTTPVASAKIESLEVNNKKISEGSPSKKAQATAEGQTETSSPHVVLWGFAITGLILILGFYGSLLWALWTGNASNPLFETLGIETFGLKTLLLNTTTIIFGLVALGFLITTLIYVFHWGTAKKEDTGKKGLLVRFFLYFFLFIVTCGAWFFFYYIIEQSGDARSANIDNSMIATDPASVIGLSSPVTVQFDIGKTLFEKINKNVVRQINWDFDGDAKVDASGPTVTHRFLNRGHNNGRFIVEAEVFYFSVAEGKEVSFKSQKEVIIANESVTAILTAVPEAGPFPLEVEFNASESKDPDGNVVLYEWDLDGDGTFEIRGNEPTITETFNKVGEYTINVRVTGQNNDSSTAKKVIQVQTPASDLQAIITSKDPLEGYSPLKIMLDASQSFVKEGLITRYEWFVEGEESAVLGRTIERIFRTPGKYKIRLTVQNDLGEKQQTEKIITVLEDELEPEVVIRTTPTRAKNEKILQGVVPFEVTFDASDSKIKDPIEWQWDFENDGIVDLHGKSVKYTFRTPGTYEAHLLIVDSSKKQYEKTMAINVNRSGVIAKISADPPAGPAPLSITFDGSGSITDKDAGNIVNYIWEFPGQDPINYGAQIDYLFEKVGNYVIKMTVLTSKGKTATDSVIVSARAPVVKANFKVAPNAGPAPLDVKATPFISQGIIKEYVWDFGDPVQAPYHVFRPDPQRYLYKEPGEYTLKLRLIDQNGIVSEQTQKVTVK